jgi:hypothetical protein
MDRSGIQHWIAYVMITSIMSGFAVETYGFAPCADNKHLHPERFNETQVSEVTYFGTSSINRDLASHEYWTMGSRS